jgi:hypothetical protein
MAMSNQLAIRNMDELDRISDMFAQSGLFADAKDAARAGVKILAGQAWGIDPFSAMTGIHLIQNRPTVSAGLMAAAVKAHPRYDYRVRERTDKVCRIEFFEGSESLGVSPYTIEMAKRAGLLSNQTWQKYPEAMLFARAMSSGVRTYCPDVLGATVYTPEELGAEVDDEGVPVRVEVERVERPVKPSAPALEAPAPEPEPEAAPEAPEPAEDAEPLASDDQKAAILREMKNASVPPKTRMPLLRWFFDADLKRIDDLSAQQATSFLAMVASGGFEDKLAAYADHISFSLSGDEDE